MSIRIKTIAEFIPPYRNIADVGCDHGYLILEAFEKYHIIHAQAIDNKQGPLQNAMKNLQKYQSQVTFTLSNGLQDLEPENEVVIIAGMGGMLIIKILSENLERLENVKRIIIQANRDLDKIRQFALNNHFQIVSEKIIDEESIFYEIIVLEKGSSNYTKADLMFGPCLLKEKSPLFMKKWTKEYQKLSSIQSAEAQAKAKFIKDVLQLEVPNENK
ncbi:MAG TPA: tRNA (adenine(22)-N(1))-methyltransferase TrmK [Bacilli bacterium]